MTVALVTLVGMGALIAMRAYFLAPEGWSALAPDEAQRAWHALQVMDGRLIYRDLWVQYTPLSFYWHAFAFWILGPSLMAIRLALVATGTVTLALVASVARQIGGSAGAIIAGALFITYGIPCYNSGYPAWEAMAFSMAALVVVLRPRPSTRRAAMAGLLAGLSAMTKINVGALSLLALVTVLAMGSGRRYKVAVSIGAMATVTWLVRTMAPVESILQFLLPLGLALVVAARMPRERISGKTLVAAASGFTAACLLILSPFVVRMGPAAVYHAVIQEPLRFSSFIGYGSPVLRLGGRIYATATCWMAALLIGLAFPRLRIPGAIMAAAAACPLLFDSVGLLPGVAVGLRFLVTPILLTAVGVMAWKGLADLSLAAAALWAGFLHIQVFPGQSGMHLAWAMTPAWPLLVGIARRAATVSGRWVWLLPSALLLSQALQDGRVYALTRWRLLPQSTGGIEVPRRDADQIAAVIDSLRVKGESPVLDLTSGCLFAFLAERSCPLKHAYFWRGFLTADDEYEEVRLLASSPPPVAIRRHRGRDQFRWDTIRSYAPTLAGWVDAHYRPETLVGHYEILRWDAALPATEVGLQPGHTGQSASGHP